MWNMIYAIIVYPHSNNVKTLQFPGFIKILNQIDVKSRKSIIYSSRFPTSIINARDKNDPKNAISMKIFLLPRLSERLPQKISATTDAVEAADDVIP